MYVRAVLLGNYFLEIVRSHGRLHRSGRSERGRSNHTVANLHTRKLIHLAVLVHIEIKEQLGLLHTRLICHIERHIYMAALFVTYHLPVGPHVLSLENHRLTCCRHL